ncbi:DNA mismatch repair protein, putative, partial [Eimeria tenella]
AAAAAATAAAAAGELWPQRLWDLCASPEEGGSFPLLLQHCSKLKAFLCLQPDGNITPVKGLVPEYDSAAASIAKCRSQLEEILEQLQQAAGMSLKYSHTKFKYEVECPENISKETLRRLDADITSSRKGFIRFRTPAICELVDQLEDFELELNDSFYPFRCRLMKQFAEVYNEVFAVSVHCINELDVLQSLATFALTHP